MLFKLEDFIAAPSQELLNLAKKSDLLDIASHYSIPDVKTSMLKREIKNVIIQFLVDEEFFEPSATSLIMVSQTDIQLKELELKRHLELEKLRLEFGEKRRADKEEREERMQKEKLAFEEREREKQRELEERLAKEKIDMEEREKAKQREMEEREKEKHREMLKEIELEKEKMHYDIKMKELELSIRFWHKYTRRTPFTLTRFYKVIVQQILNFFPEILLSFRMKSIRMLFHRFCSFNNVYIMVDFIGSGWNVRK